MVVWLSLLILILVLTMIRKGGHERKGDLGFVLLILLVVLLAFDIRL